MPKLLNRIILFNFKFLDIAGIDKRKNFLKFKDQVNDPVSECFGDVEFDHGSFYEQIL